MFDEALSENDLKQLREAMLANIVPILETAKVMIQQTRDSGVLQEVAKTYRAFYDALRAEGFTTEEAMTLVPTYKLNSQESK